MKKKCPSCGADMVLMKSGKGFRCGRPGNRWVNGRWSLCQGTEWINSNSSNFPTRSNPIIRAADFPKIAKPTAEQLALRNLLSIAPKAREEGSRLTISDDGPGTAKTTSVSWSLCAVFHRLGNLSGYGVRAFNINAREVLQGKLPPQVPDVNTLHSSLKTAQGYRGMANTKKIFQIYSDLISNIPFDMRPRMGCLKKVLEASRALCLYAREDDRARWRDIISQVQVRFGGLAKKINAQFDLLMDYLPAVASRSLSDGTKLDFNDMIARPVQLALQKLDKQGFKLPVDLTSKPGDQWSDEDVRTFARVIRAIDLPPMDGLVVDESQDLDPSQLACILAQTWKTGELTLIGDDAHGNPEDDDYKAGQAVYDWRGAFGGVLNLTPRLWHELTGESTGYRPLTVTFRHGPEICDAYRPLNKQIQTALPEGYSKAGMVSDQFALAVWLTLPQRMTALWITRTNQASAIQLLATLLNYEDCCIRGGGDFESAVIGALYEAAGWADEKTGEYQVSWTKALEKLRELEAEERDGSQSDPNSITSFLIVIADALQANPSLFDKAELTDRKLTVGNLKRFVLYFVNKKSRRTITNIYRCKGDEADVSIVDDVGKFNESWGNPVGDRAARHVALSRAKRLLLTVGHVVGSDMTEFTDDDLGDITEWLSSL